MKGPAEIAHGPMLIGIIFNVLLYGIMIAQTYIYFTTYKKDRTWMKIFVFAVFLADTLNTIFDLVYIYESVIIHFADIAFLQKANWRFATDPAMTGIIELMVQLFFSWRIFVLTRNWVSVIIVVALSITAGVCAIVTTYEIIIIPEFTKFQEFQNVVIVWLSCASAADIIITLILVRYLRSHKTGFRGSDLMVDRIIRVSVQTGLITSMVAIVDLVVYLADSSGTHLMLNFPLCKLYSNSLISSLNSRGGWKYNDTSTLPPQEIRTIPSERPGQTNDDDMHSGWEDDVTYSSRNPATKATHLFDSMRPGNRAKPEVFVHVESHEMRDVASVEKGSDSRGRGTQLPAPGRNGVVVVIPPSGYPPSREPNEPSIGSSESDALPSYAKVSKGYQS
ncbi:hypothetical protein P691DRAFT_808166 [Macrolepiota fuliginosa MF-IS2]|uniref:DUF6534 domain-containing protein n=1 Tax=Macrolepiota fuliginosa MF-IS2 TaxID=1400762 RepID=A0A9P5X4I4_9AGAR|nr:hypothetical protein P691DRAFT_808166 [Macrolepiota fuliginosa MF-IS2]